MQDWLLTPSFGERAVVVRLIAHVDTTKFRKTLETLSIKITDIAPRNALLNVTQEQLKKMITMEEISIIGIPIQYRMCNK